MIEERRKLEQDIRDGKIFESIPQTGMGRGAAMTLPAWMTEVSARSFLKHRERENGTIRNDSKKQREQCTLSTSCLLE